MKIGIMGAMPEEIDIIRQQMTQINEIQLGQRTYYCGFIDNYEIVLVFSRCGKVAAATTATSLIEKFEIEQLIFTGVAGAVSPELNIGDIVISSQLYQHDMDASPLFERHVIPLLDITFFHADTILIKASAEAGYSFLDNRQSIIPLQTLRDFNISQPKLVQGVIASGDQFVADYDVTKKILSNQPQTLAVEMEGAAVAQVCYEHQKPFVVIRTISDTANHQSYIDFPRFINKVANTIQNI